MQNLQIRFFVQVKLYFYYHTYWLNPWICILYNYFILDKTFKVLKKCTEKTKAIRKTLNFTPFGKMLDTEV